MKNKEKQIYSGSISILDAFFMWPRRRFLLGRRRRRCWKRSAESDFLPPSTRYWLVGNKKKLGKPLRRNSVNAGQWPTNQVDLERNSVKLGKLFVETR